jgi:hypothetical protein
MFLTIDSGVEFGAKKGESYQDLALNEPVLPSVLSFVFNLHWNSQSYWEESRCSVSVLPPAINPFSPRIILRICLPGQERDFFCGGNN